MAALMERQGYDALRPWPLPWLRWAAGLLAAFSLLRVPVVAPVLRDHPSDLVEPPRSAPGTLAGPGGAAHGTCHSATTC
ncbi:MAG: hypothetical protein ABI873_00715 [Marmoricola sp.]